MNIRNLTDETLHLETIRAFTRERGAIADAVEHLAEISRRRLYLKYGVPSLYRYGMTHLGLSEFSALQRARAARLACELPETIAKLREGRLTLCAASEAWRAFEERARTAQAEAPAARQVQVQPVELPLAAPHASPAEAPAPPPPTLTLARVEKRAVLQSLEGKSRDEIRKTLSAIRPDSGSKRPRPRAAWMGYQGEWRELRLHLSERERIRLERLRSLLSHKIPSGDLTEAFNRLIEEGLDRHDPERIEARARKRRERAAGGGAADPAPLSARDAPINHGQGAGPRVNRAPVPPRLRREVLVRDGLRCQYPAWHGGLRCLSSWSIDVDHVLPRSQGGPNRIENLRAVCAAHNRNRPWLERGEIPAESKNLISGPPRRYKEDSPSGVTCPNG